MTSYPIDALKRKWQRTDAKIVEVLVFWDRFDMALENILVHIPPDAWIKVDDEYGMCRDAMRELAALRHENPRKGHCPPVTMTLDSSPCSGHTCALWPCEAVDMSHPRKEAP